LNIQRDGIFVAAAAEAARIAALGIRDYEVRENPNNRQIVIIGDIA